MEEQKLQDQAWIERSLKGDREAFGCLVTLYQQRLYRTMLAISGSVEDAEDVVQDAFVQAFRKLDTFQGGSRFYTWLHRIAVNLWISRQRRRINRDRPASLDADGSLEIADTVDQPELQASRAEQLGRLHAALAELPDEQRTILILRELEGCCYESISATLGLPIGTVRSRLHRARLRLKQLLERTIQEPS